MNTEDFTKVTHKRKYKKQLPINDQFSNLSLSEDDFDIDKAVRRIVEAKDDILTSDYYMNVQASLREALSLLITSISRDSHKLNSVVPKELICFGIGHIADCMISRYQFAFILLVSDLYSIKVIKVSDPILSKKDIKVLEYFKIDLIESNIEAKYKVFNYTLFYLPHCPKQLSNNLLWSNWSNSSLEKCIILSNSFLSLLESNTRNHLIKNAEYLLKISSYVEEIAVINTFKYFEIFNDLALHVFPELKLIDKDFWLQADKPKYFKDIEYIEA